MINIRKFIQSVKYAISGIVSMIQSENNARIHLLATMLVLAAGYYFHISTIDWLWIALSIALVWAAEAINTAIEALVDLYTTEQHPLAKKAKDVAAAAVFIVAGFALVVAFYVFAKHLLP